MSEVSGSVRGSKTTPTNPQGVPDLLSFDRIIASGTCPPCTIRDFMDYLIYIERAAEHLQFFMWFRGYGQRFESLKGSDKVLSPEWTHQNQRDALEEWKKTQANIQKQQTHTTANEVFKGTIFSKEGSANHRPLTNAGSGNPFVTPPATAHGGSHPPMPTSNVASPTRWGSPTNQSTTFNSLSNATKATASSVAHDAFESAGLNQPFTIQPFRREIEHVIQTYIAEGSPRELNISSGQRKTLLKALEVTTHPTVFTRVIADVESVLRSQLHPNFIRWTICNGNRPRVYFARVLGMSLILSGILIELFIALSNVPRGFRALGAIALVIGVATLFAAVKGMCVVLHGMHHRHLRPWELFADEENDKDSNGSAYSMRESLDSIQSSNSYQDAPWVVRYQKRSIIRKIFDREIRVSEPALRHIQDMIFLQSILAGFVVALVLTAVFVAVPEKAYI